MENTLFVLTDGNEVFDRREMNMLDLEKAQAILTHLFWAREDTRIDVESLQNRRAMMELMN